MERDDLLTKTTSDLHSASRHGIVVIRDQYITPESRDASYEDADDGDPLGAARAIIYCILGMGIIYALTGMGVLAYRLSSAYFATQ